MEVEEAICLWLLYKRNKRRKVKKRRKFWIHPSISNRLTHSHFVILYPKLRKNASEFFDYFKMSIGTFDSLIALVRDQITSAPNLIRDCLSPEEKLVISIRYFTSGCSFTDLHDDYKIGTSTASVIIRQVCEAVLSIVQPISMPKPTKEIWKNNEIEFSKFAKFPHCIGVIDGKHINIIMRSQNKDFQSNNKRNNGILTLFAICNFQYGFVAIDVQSQRSLGEPATFSDSLFYKKLVDNSFDIPDSKSIISSENPKCLPHVFIGGEALPFMENIMKCYKLKELNLKKFHFNDRLLTVKRRIDIAFGILVSKWQVLSKTLSVNEDFAMKIIKTCCILHNYLLLKDGQNYEEALFKSSLADLSLPIVDQSSQAALLVRESFTQYFSNNGLI